MMKNISNAPGDQPHLRCGNTFRGLVLILCLLTAPASSATAVVATTPDSPAGQEIPPLNREEILLELFGPPDQFVYHSENRSDPFLPFIQEKVIQPRGTGGAEEDLGEDLTGLRKFEPGQLSLVAILFKGDTPMAMVQDPVGQGYVIKEGMRIGRHGIVEQITPGTVIVKETTGTWDQKTFSKRVEMVLRKEGEQ